MKSFWRSLLVILLILVPIAFICLFFYFGYIVVKAKEEELSLVQTTKTQRSHPKKYGQEFILNIPKISLSQKVESNIDPWNQRIYGPVLERNLAHGRYTLLPDQLEFQERGVTYIFGHRVGLGGFLERLNELELGDNLYIFYRGEKYTFRVVDKKVVSATTTDVYTSNSSIPLLRIQTCENGEKDRLIVDAELIKD